jgi:hypothetical protein
VHEARPVIASVDVSVRRRRIEVGLGVLWLLDGLLQFQPDMFSRSFMEGILGMANMGLPGPLARADFDVARLLTTGYGLWNALFAALQVAIGVGLIWGPARALRVARPVSVVWALGIWTVGEGVGGMFMGGTSLLTGAPGAALLYAIVALLIWPPRIHVGPGRVFWSLLWVGVALLELQTTNHAAGVPGAQIANGAFGEPAVIAGFDRAVGHLLSGRGSAFAVGVGTVAVFVGLGVLWNRTRKSALAVGVVMAVFVGVAGQDLGGVLTGHGTDPGTGPLLILLAAALWPVSVPGGAALRDRQEADSGAQSPAVYASCPNRSASASSARASHRSSVSSR